MLWEIMIEIIEELFKTLRDIVKDIMQAFSKPAGGGTRDDKEPRK